MKKNMKIILLVSMTLLLVLGGCAASVKDYTEFASCVSLSGAKMYGTEWCSHCQNQKAEFGNSFQYVNYVDCDRNRNDCNKAGVGGYPTWVINGSNYPGEQRLGRLADLSGCELVEDLIE